jgi:putative glycosyltransferase (TIGR04372 family)
MKFLRSLLLIPAALVVIGVRVLDLFGVNIKFSNFLSSRIGHLVGNTEVYLCERDMGMHSGIHIWTHYGPIASEQIALMWKRVMRVWPSHFMALVILINKMFPGWERHEIGSNTLDRDPKSLLDKCKPHLKFTLEERARGEVQLRKWGLPAGAQWVCLMVRDGAYLPEFGYHSYRDCDVDTYTDAALMLAERGYYVFRMGKKVAKPFAAKHPRIFDFATDGTYSDFMGVYLGAYCAFCVSTSTGWDAIPQAFRRPMCYTNFAPFEYIPTWLPNSLAIWKHHKKATLTKIKGRLVNGAWEAYTDTGKGETHGSTISLSDDELTDNDWRRISVSEIVESGAGKFMKAEEFLQNGIALEDNSPQEILDVVREMADMIEGRFHPARQEEFWDAFPKSELHGEIRIRIGSKFLEGYHAEQQADTGSDTSTRRIAAGSV